MNFRCLMTSSVVVWVALSIGCNRSSKIRQPSVSFDLIVETALNPRSVSRTPTLFHKLPASETGIDMVHQFPADAGLELMADQNSGSGTQSTPDIGFGWLKVKHVTVRWPDGTKRTYEVSAAERFGTIPRRSEKIAPASRSILLELRSPRYD